MSEYISVTEALAKINSIIDEVQASVKPAELTPDMLSALSKQGFVEGSIDWYNGLEHLMVKGNSKVMGEAQDFFYYKWTPVLKRKLNSMFTVSNPTRLASAAIDQLDDFLSNPETKSAFTTGNYNLAKCLCIQITRKGDYAFIESFIKTIYAAFLHWLGGGSVRYAYKRGQERINAAFLEKIPVGTGQSNIVPAPFGGKGAIVLQHIGTNYRPNAEIASLDDLLDIRGYNIIVESGFRTSMRRLFAHNIVFNTDAYSVNDLERALSIDKTGNETNVESAYVESAYRSLRLANEIVTDDEFVDMNKEVFSSESRDRVNLAAGKFPEIERQVKHKKGYYYDLMTTIIQATHLDISTGFKDTDGKQIAQEFLTFYYSLFAVDLHNTHTDSQERSVKSGKNLGDAPNFSKESGNKLNEAAGGDHADDVEALAVSLGLNWSKQSLDYFDNLLGYANRTEDAQIDAENSTAGTAKPYTMENSYWKMFSYYLLYIAGSLNSQLGGDYSLKNIFQHLKRNSYHVEEIMLVILYVEGRVDTTSKGNYTYPERTKFLRADIKALKTAAENGKDVDDTEVINAIQSAESRKINGVSIMDTIWDTFVKECKAKFPQESYNVDTLENFYLTYKGLLEDGNDQAANALYKLLTSVVQKLTKAEKEPLPL